MDSVAARLTMLIGLPIGVLVAVIVLTIYVYQRWSAKLADGSTASFLFPSRSSLHYPAERLDEALEQVKRHLEAARP